MYQTTYGGLSEFQKFRQPPVCMYQTTYGGLSESQKIRQPPDSFDGSDLTLYMFVATSCS